MSAGDQDSVTAEWVAGALQEQPGLPIRARRVLELRYGIGGAACSDEEIARMFNISPERVHQIIEHSVSTLRDGITGA